MEGMGFGLEGEGKRRGKLGGVEDSMCCDFLKLNDRRMHTLDNLLHSQ